MNDESVAVRYPQRLEPDAHNEYFQASGLIGRNLPLAYAEISADNFSNYLEMTGQEYRSIDLDPTPINPYALTGKLWVNKGELIYPVNETCFILRHDGVFQSTAILLFMRIFDRMDIHLDRCVTSYINSCVNKRKSAASVGMDIFDNNRIRMHPTGAMLEREAMPAPTEFSDANSVMDKLCEFLPSQSQYEMNVEYARDVFTSSNTGTVLESRREAQDLVLFAINLGFEALRGLEENKKKSKEDITLNALRGLNQLVNGTEWCWSLIHIALFMSILEGSKGSTYRMMMRKFPTNKFNFIHDIGHLLRLSEENGEDDYGVFRRAALTQDKDLAHFWSKVAQPSDNNERRIRFHYIVRIFKRCEIKTMDLLGILPNEILQDLIDMQD
jgi:hypothetical protein